MEEVDILPFSRLLRKEWNCRDATTGGELNFVMDLSGKFHEVYRALSNIPDCSEYSMEEAQR